MIAPVAALAQPGAGPTVTAEQAIAKAREVVTGRRACPRPEPGEVQTDIVVCGRGETARNRMSDADRVAVVMDGRIVELGTHDELVALGGEYASLWQAWNQE